MLEENSQIYSVRIYASPGTSPGRGGPFGAADQKTWNGQHLLAAFFSIPLWQRGGVKKLEYVPLTLPSPARGEGEQTEIKKKFPPP